MSCGKLRIPGKKILQDDGNEKSEKLGKLPSAGDKVVTAVIRQGRRCNPFRQLPRAQYNGKAFPPPYVSQETDEALGFDVSLFNRPYKFKIYSNGSSANLPPSLPEPDFVILCFDISNRESLRNARHHWRRAVALKFYDPADRMPIMLLGLKRDLRGKVADFILPHDAFGEAQQMRCDRYAECSALTGELMWQVLEDITKTAAKTTTEAGGKSQMDCALM